MSNNETNLPPGPIQTNLKNLRLSRGWNNVRVSELTGIPRDELLAIEDGADCRLDYLAQLADLYGVKMSDLFQPMTQFTTER